MASFVVGATCNARKLIWKKLVVYKIQHYTRCYSPVIADSIRNLLDFYVQIRCCCRDIEIKKIPGQARNDGFSRIC